MASNHPAALRPRITPGARVHQTGPRSWRLEIPADTSLPNQRRSKRYHLAQLDDYQQLPRRRFPWHPPVSLSLQARASQTLIPGTWGFGFWNDPFGVAYVKGGGLRLPTLPNAAWFFFASPENYLSLRDDLPANGALAATFSAPLRPPLAATRLIPILPFIFLPPIARWVRRQARGFIRQATAQIDLDTTQWHLYQLNWVGGCVKFLLDEKVLLETPVVPLGRLGLVIWIDNQFAALTSQGGLRFGTLPTRDLAWVEIEGLEVGVMEAA